MEMGVPILKQGNIKCSFSREMQPKHKKKKKNQKRNKEKQRETQVNRFDYKCGLQCLPERDSKPKHTKKGFILTPIFAFLCCFTAISILFF